MTPIGRISKGIRVIMRYAGKCTSFTEIVRIRKMTPVQRAFFVPVLSHRTAAAIDKPMIIPNHAEKLNKFGPATPKFPLSPLNPAR